MDTLQNLKAFLTVATTRNFSAAARQLNVAASVVTKRIDQLEWSIRAKLFERTTRTVTLTETGERFLQRVRAAVGEVDQVLQEMAHPTKDFDGMIRIKVPTTLGILYFGRLLGTFQAQHPKVHLEVVLTDRPLNPADEGFDIAVGAFPFSFTGVLDEPLCPLHRMVCASPSYLTAKGRPTHPQELVHHDTLNFLPMGSNWTFQSDRGSISVEITPKMSSNDNQVLLAATREGNGLAVLPSYVAMPSLRIGELVQVLDDFPMSDTWIKAMVPKNRIQIPRVMALLAFIKESLGQTPPWERPEWNYPVGSG